MHRLTWVGAQPPADGIHTRWILEPDPCLGVEQRFRLSARNLPASRRGYSHVHATEILRTPKQVTATAPPRKR